jgi:hypothetical protein
MKHVPNKKGESLRTPPVGMNSQLLNKTVMRCAVKVLLAASY